MSLAFNSLLLTLETLAFSLPLGTALAWLLVRSDLPGRRAGLGIMGLMLFVPLYLQASAWQAGFGQEGWYSAGANGQAWLSGWNAALWVHTLAAIPWIVLIAALGLRTVEPALEEQALLDGSAWQVFWYVTPPACWPALGLAAAWTAMLTAGEMTVTSMFNVRTYAEEVYTQFAVHMESSEAAVALTPGILGTMLLLGLAVFCCVHLVRPDRPLNLRPSRTARLGPWRWPLAVVLALVVIALAGLPLTNLLYKAGVIVRQIGDEARADMVGGQMSEDDPAGPGHVSPARLLVVVDWFPGGHHRDCGGNSDGLGLAPVVPARIGGHFHSRDLPCPAGTAVGYGRHSAAGPTTPCVAVLALRSLDPRPWLAQTIRALGPALLVMWHAVRTVPQPMLDSAATEGCGPLGQLWYIVLPQRRGAVAVAWLIGLALALGDFAATSLVVPPGVETLSMRILNLAHFGVDDQVAGICLALVVMFGLLAAAVARLAKRL